mmetsp:Transcript_14950/g.44308  ORF Transcript_14950/g.44308 Transcript_14950/m.44308 type:complete len:222 (-) Transcript_14950:191-856(-)
MELGSMSRPRTTTVDLEMFVISGTSVGWTCGAWRRPSLAVALICSTVEGRARAFCRRAECCAPARRWDPGCPPDGTTACPQKLTSSPCLSTRALVLSVPWRAAVVDSCTRWTSASEEWSASEALAMLKALWWWISWVWSHARTSTSPSPSRGPHNSWTCGEERGLHLEACPAVALLSSCTASLVQASRRTRVPSPPHSLTSPLPLIPPLELSSALVAGSST